MTEKLNLSKRFDLISMLNFILLRNRNLWLGYCFYYSIPFLYFMCNTLSRCHDVTCDCLTMTPTQEARRIIWRNKKKRDKQNNFLKVGWPILSISCTPCSSNFETWFLLFTSSDGINCCCPKAAVVALYDLKYDKRGKIKSFLALFHLNSHCPPRAFCISHSS